MRLALKAATVVALATALCGCAGKLIVYDADKKETVGIPIRTAEIYVKRGLHNKAAKGGDCDNVEFQEIVALPTGAQYYVTATSAAFAKTAFHVKFNDVGGLSEIGLDTEPAGAENIRATAELIKTLAPLAGISAAAKAADAKGKPACDSGETLVTYERLEDYLRRHPPP